MDKLAHVVLSFMWRFNHNSVSSRLKIVKVGYTFKMKPDTCKIIIKNIHTVIIHTECLLGNSSNAYEIALCSLLASARYSLYSTSRQYLVTELLYSLCSSHLDEMKQLLQMPYVQPAT